MTKLVGWDLETTSAEVKTTRIVQLGALLDHANGAEFPHLGEPGSIEVLADCLLNPGVAIHPEAAAVHGITNERVKDEQRDVDVANEFVDMLETLNQVNGGIVQATHNGLQFDRPVLERITERSLRMPMIDTLILSRRLYPNADNHRLTTLTEMFKLGSTDKAHDALADVKMVCDLVKHFCRSMKMDVRTLAEYCEKPMVLTTCYFGKHKGKHFEDVPPGYIDFICREFDDPSHDMIATVEFYFGKRFIKVPR